MYVFWIGPITLFFKHILDKTTWTHTPNNIPVYWSKIQHTINDNVPWNTCTKSLLLIIIHMGTYGDSIQGEEKATIALHLNNEEAGEGINSKRTFLKHF